MMRSHLKSFESMHSLYQLMWCHASFFFFIYFYVLVKVRVRFVAAPLVFKQAVVLLGNRESRCESETEKIKTALLPLYLNLSLTELRLDSPIKALKYGSKALEMDSTNTKALFRCGQVRPGFCL